MTATSSDGINFTRTNTVVTDQANVPDLVMTPDGTLYLYYAGWEVGDRENVAAVAISSDQGATWEFHQINYTGEHPMAHSSDPDIVLLADGTFRLFSTSDINNGQMEAIYVSDSTDGIHFANKGVAFQANPSSLDSNTFLVDDIWHMYTLSFKSMKSYHATSTDGVNFTKQNLSEYKIDQYQMVMSNVLLFDDLYRMYAFSPQSQDIRSFTSTDGTTWTPETGIRLALDQSSTQESEFVKDPAVIKLLDGTYLMVYVTQIPK